MASNHRIAELHYLPGRSLQALQGNMPLAAQHPPLVIHLGGYTPSKKAEAVILPTIRRSALLWHGVCHNSKVLPISGGHSMDCCVAELQYFLAEACKHGNATSPRLDDTHIIVVHCNTVGVAKVCFFAFKQPGHLCLILWECDVHQGLWVEGLLCQLAKNVAGSSHPKDRGHGSQYWYNPNSEPRDNLQQSRSNHAFCCSVLFS